VSVGFTAPCIAPCKCTCLLTYSACNMELRVLVTWLVCCRIRAYDATVTGVNVTVVNSFSEQGRLSTSSSVSDAEEDRDEPGFYLLFVRCLRWWQFGVVVLISVVALCWHWLFCTILERNQPPMLTQPGHPSGIVRMSTSKSGGLNRCTTLSLAIPLE